MTNDNSAEAGFTLLEMIVAFLILSISMAVASQTLSIAVSSYMRSGERQTMLELVEALKAGTVPEMALSRSPVRQGEAGSLRWKVDLLSPRPGTDRGGNKAFAIIIISNASAKTIQHFLVTAALPERQQ